ncbi:MAG TPA: PqiC family protein [Opitutaceae bacterium]|nr:PqiC family protein [Opitutaceae bacterium]
MHGSSPVWHPGATLGRPGSGIRNPLPGISLLAAVLGLVAACNLPLPQAQPDATRYFLLSAISVRPEAVAAAGKRWMVGVRAVELPAFLRTRSMAIRSRANEVAFLDFARWGEPLDQGIARVLAEDLRADGNVERAVTAPFRADDLRDFEVGVRVTACEGTADGDVRFAAAWRMTAPGVTGGMVAEGDYVAAGLRWDGHDHAQLAAKLSEAVAGLSRDIAAALPKETGK